tara:strand:+ start:773 stop:976 length:204 start_codon:yes stop_codon:yes gene_type:complete
MGVQSSAHCDATSHHLTRSDWIGNKKRNMTMKKKNLDLKLATPALMLFVMGAWVWFIAILFFALTDV